MFRIKIAAALLVAGAALSLSAQPVQAGWHHWGCQNYWYSYPYVAVYTPVVYTPVYYSHWSTYRPYSWYGGCCSGYGGYGYSSLYYYTPAYTRCGGSGYSIGGCYSVAPNCCGGAVIQSYKSVVPSTGAEPTPAESSPAIPTSPEPATRSVVPPPPAPEEPGIAPPAAQPPLPEPPPAEPGPPEPADAPPALPPEPDAAAPPTPQPDAVVPPDPTPALPLLPGNDGASRQPADSAVLAVQVPEDARVYVNGMLTKTPGAYRQYVSRGLSRGSDYTYEVRVEVTRNGHTYDSTRTVNLRAGGTARLAFSTDRMSPQVVNRSGAETSLTLRVPQSARVSLEGRPTEATGAVRTFTTRQLRSGERWADYRVVVELERNGRFETREKTIDLIGGENHELSFDFQPERVALR